MANDDLAKSNRIDFGLNQEGKENIILPLKQILLSPKYSNALNINEVENAFSQKLISNANESSSDETLTIYMGS